MQLRQAEDALTNGEADRQALISQRAAALEQQGQRVEALEKQLQKLQEVERGSRQEVEKLSRQLYIKRPQVTLLAILALLICFSVQFNPPLCICHVGTCMKRNRKTTPFTLIFMRSQVIIPGCPGESACYDLHLLCDTVHTLFHKCFLPACCSVTVCCQTLLLSLTQNISTMQKRVCTVPRHF